MQIINNLGSKSNGSNPYSSNNNINSSNVEEMNFGIINNLGGEKRTETLPDGTKKIYAQDGSWKTYYPNGKLKEDVSLNGLYNSRSIAKTYDENGNLKNVSFGDESGNGPDAITSKKEYDVNGNLFKEELSDGATIIYERDGGMNGDYKGITHIDITHPNGNKYTYDGNGNLEVSTEKMSNGNYVTRYYDKDPNRTYNTVYTDQNGKYIGSTEILSDGTKRDYAQDGSWKTYYPNGKLKEDVSLNGLYNSRSIAKTYDENGNLKNVSFGDESGNGPDAITSKKEYDVNGNLFKEELSDGATIIYERDGGMNGDYKGITHIDVTHPNGNKYTYDGNGNLEVSTEKMSNGNYVTRYYDKDPNRTYDTVYNDPNGKYIGATKTNISSAYTTVSGMNTSTSTVRPTTTTRTTSTSSTTRPSTGTSTVRPTTSGMNSASNVSSTVRPTTTTRTTSTSSTVRPSTGTSTVRPSTTRVSSMNSATNMSRR